MKTVLTGSLGHIGKPLTKKMVQQGHNVTVISSNPERQTDINALGAQAAIGSIEDADVLTSAFHEADAVYVMEPPVSFFNHDLNIESYYNKLGHNFKTAILNSGVKHVVHLSSIGAHMSEANGILIFHYLVENILKTLPEEITLTHIRPLSFYYNLLGFVQGIMHTGKITANYGGDDIIPWVSPSDIAEVIAEELTSRENGRKFRYVVSDELTCNETAAILGEAIGRPDLKWEIISDEQMQSRLKSIGMAPHLAAGLVEMNFAMHTCTLFDHYYQHRPATFGQVKMTDYAKDFAKIYNK